MRQDILRLEGALKSKGRMNTTTESDSICLNGTS